MNANPLRARVANRGAPPDSFLQELIQWGETAPDEIFSPNDQYDVYSSVVNELGPYKGLLHRKAVMLEVMRVLAGFESSWNWNEGRDTSNPDSDTPDEIEAGAWQVSANSRHFGKDLQEISPKDGNEFQKAMKEDHNLAMEYIARLLRHTVRHNGPVRDKLINHWLRRDAVKEFMHVLS